eukprot:COSAG03_NODE_20850_length_312_cov_1.610329_1_plen_90_part_00
MVKLDAKAVFLEGSATPVVLLQLQIARDVHPARGRIFKDPEHVLSVQTASFERMNLTSLELRRNLSMLGPLTYEIQAQRPGKTKAVWTA